MNSSGKRLKQNRRFMRTCRFVSYNLGLLIMVCVLTFFFATSVYAVGIDELEGTGIINEAPNDFNLNITSNAGNASLSTTLQMLLMLTVLSLAPSILIMLTCFTRIIIVLHFTRSALGTMTTPPNQVLIGLALFLTLFIMSPVLTEVNEVAIQPLTRGEISQEIAIEEGLKPIRTFMLKQTNRSDIRLFMDISGSTAENLDENTIPTTVLIPAFMISELRKAFTIGFLIYLPFIVIDMVVASTLMSMGMMMLPPTTISMPFKILLFILADGWNLVIGQVVRTFFTS